MSPVGKLSTDFFVPPKARHYRGSSYIYLSTWIGKNISTLKKYLYKAGVYLNDKQNIF